MPPLTKNHTHNKTRPRLGTCDSAAGGLALGGGRVTRARDEHRAAGVYL